MARLSLTLLGGFRARLDDGRVVSVPIKKAQALLGYLSIPLGQAHARDKLAALLWGDMRPPQARAGLRQALFVIRKAAGFAPTLASEDETVALDPSAVAVDVGELEDAVAQDTPESLEHAAALYRGDLLEGLSLEEPPFEEWLTAERVRLRELALEALAKLLAVQRDEGAPDAAVRTGLRLVSLDPLQEPVHRTLMRLYAQLGRRGAALRQYQLCVAALQRELRAEPEDETKALYREILQRRLARPSPPAVAIPDGADDSRGPMSAETTVVGREVQLAQLRDALQAAWAAGTGQLVVVIGEAGIGKSTLAAALTADATRKGGRVLVGRCYESEQVLALGPWIDALRAGGVAEDRETLGKLAPAWRPELARLLPEIADGPLPATTASAQLFEAVAQLLERMAAVRPVLLVIEDAHWADETSVRLLAFVARRLQHARLLTVVTVRDEDVADAPILRRTLDELIHARRAVRCDVGPLSRADTIALARTLLPLRDASLAEEPLWRASEGNPFMVVETARALRGRSVEAATSALPLPERIRNLIAYRLERLGPRGRHLVTVAAVIGRPFAFALLQRAADLDEAEAADGVEELVRQRVLRSHDEAFELAHDRIREVVEAELLAPRRALLHRRVAESIEALHAGALDPHAHALGMHYHEAQQWDKALVHLTQAGRQAAGRSAHRDAAVCYRRATAALARLSDREQRREQACDLQVALVHSLFQAGDLDGARAAFEAAAALAAALGDPRRLGEVQAGTSYMLGAQGNFAGAIESGSRALETARSLRDAGLETWTRIGLGQTYLAASDYPHAIEHLRSAIGTLARFAVDERFGRPSMLPSIASRTNLAITLSHTGDFVEGIELGEEALRIAETVNQLQERAWAGYTLGRVLVSRGEVESAIPLLERALALCGDGQFPLYVPRVLATLGLARTIEGHPHEAIELLEEARAEAQAIAVLAGHPWIAILTATAYLEAGRLVEAERHAMGALALSGHTAPGDEAWSRHVLGRIAARKDPADLLQALEHTRQALGLARRLGMAPLEARCHLALAALHQRAGHGDAAREAMADAVPMLEAMGLRHWLRAAQVLRDAG